jgi:integrase/recombinase XerD
MHQQSFRRGTLFTLVGQRKYLNADERCRFVRAAKRAAIEVRLFCLMLRWTGARISEVLALTPAAIDQESGAVCILTLKRREVGIVRQVAVPKAVIQALDRTFQVSKRQRDPELAVKRIWDWSRTTAWRRVKEVMFEAHITGASAMPKGLRHAFGVQATHSKVPMHLVQKWLGHASIESTAIYVDVMGPDEREFAVRMWRGSSMPRRARR